MGELVAPGLEFRRMRSNTANKGEGTPENGVRASCVKKVSSRTNDIVTVKDRKKR